MLSGAFRLANPFCLLIIIWSFCTFFIACFENIFFKIWFRGIWRQNIEQWFVTVRWRYHNYLIWLQYVNDLWNECCVRGFCGLQRSILYYFMVTKTLILTICVTYIYNTNFFCTIFRLLFFTKIRINFRLYSYVCLCTYEQT